jgi:hypothetical protein
MDSFLVRFMAAREPQTGWKTRAFTYAALATAAAAIIAASGFHCCIPAGIVSRHPFPRRFRQLLDCGTLWA